MDRRDIFDRWLEEGLKRELDPVVTGRAPASRPRYRRLPGQGLRRLSLLGGGASTALLLKLGTGATMVAFAAGTALSGTPNPARWGAQVSQRLDQCEAALAIDQHGVGQCVSVFTGQASEPPRPAPPAAQPAPDQPRRLPGPPATIEPAPARTPGAPQSPDIETPRTHTGSQRTKPTPAPAPSGSPQGEQLPVVVAIPTAIPLSPGPASRQ